MEMCFSNGNSTNFAIFWKFFQFFDIKNWEKYHVPPSTYTFRLFAFFFFLNSILFCKALKHPSSFKSLKTDLK
jgi:hypothetical protein